MHRTARRALRLALLAMATAPLAGCYTASGAQLGRSSNDTVSDGMGVGDALGAAMFQQDVRIAAANARRQIEASRGYATVNVPTD
jgi:hypothetical protein